jgi:hypothetical protein
MALRFRLLPVSPVVLVALAAGLLFKTGLAPLR